MNERRQEALIRDLERLRAEIPELIEAVRSGDEKGTGEAVAVVTGASGKRFNFLMNRLTDYVVAEAIKGNKRPLQMVASGEAWD